MLAVQRAFDGLARSGAVAGPRPLLFASQFSGCAPIAKAFGEGRQAVERWETMETPRGGMRTPHPQRGAEVLKAVAAGGAYAVDPAQAAQAVAQIAKDDGILVGLETGSALFAVQKALEMGVLNREAVVVVLNTATPLKSDPVFLPRRMM